VPGDRPGSAPIRARPKGPRSSYARVTGSFGRFGIGGPGDDGLVHFVLEAGGAQARDRGTVRVSADSSFERSAISIGSRN